jgi:hypothetical protein
MTMSPARVPPVRVVVVLTVGTALVSSALAVMVNLATEWETSGWAWLAVAALTMISGGLSWRHQRQTRTESSPGAEGASAGGTVHIGTTESGVVGAVRIENLHQHYYRARAAALDDLSSAAPGRRRRLLMVVMVIGALLVAGGGAVGFWLTGRVGEQALVTDLAPASGLVHSNCMQVTGKNVRVFTDPYGEQTWTMWTTGTRFWVDPDTSGLHRYRTTLRNGSQGWVGANPQWVASASDCT